MKPADGRWVLLLLCLAGVAGGFIYWSMGDNHRWVALTVIALQTTLTLACIAWSRSVESRQLKMLHGRHSVPAEQLRAAVDVVESTQAVTSNSLIATGIILSAAVLVSNAARFSDPSSNAAELLSVAPKAFTATGFGLACGLLLMVRAHFGALRTFSHVQPVSPHPEPAKPAGPTDIGSALVGIAAELKSIAHALAVEQEDRAESSEQLRTAIDEISALVAETRKQVPKSALGKLAESTDRFSQDVASLVDVITDLKASLDAQAASMRETSRAEIHQALTEQAAASLDAFRDSLVTRFGQNMDQLAGKIEQQIEAIAGSARESAETWKPELDASLNRMQAKVETTAESMFSQVRDRADQYVSRRVDDVLSDMRVAEQNLDGIVLHLRDMNQNLTLLLSGLSETRLTLGNFVRAGKAESPTDLAAFLQDLGQLADTVDQVGGKLLEELGGLESRRERVRTLRHQIAKVLTEN